MHVAGALGSVSPMLHGEQFFAGRPCDGQKEGGVLAGLDLVLERCAQGQQVPSPQLVGPVKKLPGTEQL